MIISELARLAYDVGATILRLSLEQVIDAGAQEAESRFTESLTREDTTP